MEAAVESVKAAAEEGLATRPGWFARPTPALLAAGITSLAARARDAPGVCPARQGTSAVHAAQTASHAARRARRVEADSPAMRATASQLAELQDSLAAQEPNEHAPTLVEKRARRLAEALAPLVGAALPIGSAVRGTRAIAETTVRR